MPASFNRSIGARPPSTVRSWDGARAFGSPPGHVVGRPLEIGSATLFRVQFINAESRGEASASAVSMRCPACGRDGTFESLGQNDLSFSASLRMVGHRRCPNPECHTYVLVVRDQAGQLVTTFPPEVIDFDPTNVPTSVVEALTEAITCHANECYTAAAIMVRKTLEELCSERRAEGKDLKARIKALGSKVVLPQELLEGLDDLRLLGNDAAHIESRVYDQIGRDEVEVGIEFSKEVLKATYQYSALLARLRGLKASSDDESG